MLHPIIGGDQHHGRADALGLQGAADAGGQGRLAVAGSRSPAGGLEGFSGGSPQPAVAIHLPGAQGPAEVIEGRAERHGLNPQPAVVGAHPEGTQQVCPDARRGLVPGMGQHLDAQPGEFLGSQPWGLDGVGHAHRPVPQDRECRCPQSAAGRDVIAPPGGEPGEIVACAEDGNVQSTLSEELTDPLKLAVELIKAAHAGDLQEHLTC